MESRRLRPPRRDSIRQEMSTSLLAAFALCFAMPFGIHPEGSSAAPGRAERRVLTPLTVCEVLEDLSQYGGKMVAVVGRMSWNFFDGAWLSENGCSGKVLPSDPNWPYAVFLGCIMDTKPPAIVGGLEIDAEALGVKLSRLRKTTRLEYYSPLTAGRPGEKVPKVQRKETWSIVFGRVKPAPPGNRGWFGAVRAQAQVCSGEGARLDIEEPDSPQPRQ